MSNNWSGKTLGKVKIGDFIARGGMAEVYEGEHTALDRRVAVKIMRDHIDSDPLNHKRFEREARVVASMRHPNIIQIFDYELVDEQPCLIMELIPGASFGNYLKALHGRGEKLPIDMVVRIITSLASAIDHAHGKQIIHRDIKPANVLLRSTSGLINTDQPLPEDVEPILTDFGLVRLLDSSFQSSTGNVSGTPAYMSPEQARGDKVDAKTDIYSLGIMLYEMLAGTVPFDAESSLGVLMKHLNDPPPPIFGISSDLQLVINRALAKDSGIRYSTAKELADDLTSVFTGYTVSKDTIRLLNTPQKTAEKPKQSRPFAWGWAGIGALLVIGLAVIAYRFWPLTARLDKNQPVGRVSYVDYAATLDKALITFSGFPAPKAGTHYEAWYLAQGGEVRRNIGAVTIDQSGQGQLAFTDLKRGNILSLFDQLEVTLEPDNDPKPDESSGDIVASSVFPPLSLVHVRHLLVSFAEAPDSMALIQGLWSTADSLSVSADALNDAFSSNDEELVRLKTEEIINQIVGSADKSRYKDWNGDGEIDDPGDGFGLLGNGDSGYADRGYIAQSVSHAKFAAQAGDATENIQKHSADLVVCGENMTGWSQQLLEKALELQELPFDSEMSPIIDEMTLLSNEIAVGVDSNGNGLIEPIVGEGGADTAYDKAYSMAEQPLLLGANRIPPAASSK